MAPRINPSSAAARAHRRGVVGAGLDGVEQLVEAFWIVQGGDDSFERSLVDDGAAISLQAELDDAIPRGGVTSTALAKDFGIVDLATVAMRLTRRHPQLGDAAM